MEQPKTEVIDYKNGIYAIDQKLVRAFLIVGEKAAILLDTAAVRTDILGTVQSITAKPVTVVLTHGDGDHIGNLQDFAEAYIHPADRDAVLSHEHCRNVKLHALEPDTALDIGGRKLKVIFTPGHTAGSVCLLDEENGILFSGDTVSLGPVFMFGERRNMTRYLESLHTIKQLKDTGVFQTVYCCHNTCPIPAQVVEELIACVKGILDETITGVPAPMPVPTEEKPFLCRYGSCSILISPKD